MGKKPLKLPNFQVLLYIWASYALVKRFQFFSIITLLLVENMQATIPLCRFFNVGTTDDFGISDNRRLKSSNEVHTIPVFVCNKILSLIKESRDAEFARSRRFCKIFNYLLLAVFSRKQQLIQPGKMKLRVRPHFWSQCRPQKCHATSR